LEAQVSQEKEFFGGLNVMDIYHERAYWRRVAAVVAAAIILGIVAGAVLYSGKVNAEARFQVQDKDITITLYDEPCELTEHVANLPYKAVWKEGAKTFQGCYGARPDYEAVVAYFDDKTFALIPFSVVKKVGGV
jgi:hypothetical protein